MKAALTWLSSEARDMTSLHIASRFLVKAQLLTRG